MATMRRADHTLTALQVAELVDLLHPLVDFDPDVDDDWNAHVARAGVIRAHRRALAAEHGYTPWDLYCAVWVRGSHE